jgi:hypothetical protein
MGNAQKSDLSSIWRSEGMTDLRAMHRDGRYWENPICRACVENSDAWAPEPR